mmetsp:Transcript_9171/g.16496  ORF Transcript_9171/g.16496 Transcript_9171/m.16496 type:complete len:332 (-) Transcript_9171:11-1006(-)
MNAAKQNLQLIHRKTICALREDVHVNVRRRAALSLGPLHDDAAEKALDAAAASAALARALLRDTDAEVRRNSAASLGHLGSLAEPIGTSALSRSLLEDVDESVRQVAAHSLADMGAESINSQVAALTTALRSDAAECVRCEAAAMLGKLGPPAGEEAAAALIETLESDSPPVQQVAACSLGLLGESAGERGAVALVKVLREAFHDDVGARCRAFEAVRRLGSCIGEAGETVLARALLDDHDVEVRENAATLLGYVRGACQEKAFKALKRAVQDDRDASVRKKAAEALQILGAGLDKELQWLSMEVQAGRAPVSKDLVFHALQGPMPSKPET